MNSERPIETGPRPATRRPNVLFVTLDQFRADCLGSAGHPVVKTPNLDKLAERGVRFTNHFSNCAPCAPSRASLLTGLWQMNHRVTSNGSPVADSLPMLPREMRKIGYEPILFGYTDTALDPATMSPDDPRRTSYEQPMPGFDSGLLLDDDVGPWLDWLDQLGYTFPADGQRVYEPADVEIPPDRGSTWRPARYAAQHTESAFLTNAVLDWLRKPGRSESPWFAHVSYLRPHPPYLAPAPYNDMFDPAEVPAPVRAATAAEEAGLHPFVAAALTLVGSPQDDLEQRQLQATYFGMIAEVDHQLGILLDGIEELGMCEETVVVVTSDHGEQLGDHWFIEKLGFFDSSYRVPLIIRADGMLSEPGRTVEALTESVDIMPTILELVGGEPPAFADGSSLVPLLSSTSAASDWWRKAVHFEFDFREPTSNLIEEVMGLRQDECAISVIRDAHGKYVHFAGELPPLFFDLDVDPGELIDRASDPAYAQRILSYAQRLLSLRLEHTDPILANTRATPDGTVYRADPPRGRGPVG